MADTHINISNDKLDIINKYYNKSIPSLIHIYKHGLCITQNINTNSNISIYVNKNLTDIYNINKEVAFYNKESINIFSDLKIVKNNNNSYIYINHELNKINFISSCNFCKNIQEIEFTETVIPTQIIDNIDFGWLKDIIYKFKGNFKILISDSINGFVIKLIDSSIIIYINLII